MWMKNFIIKDKFILENYINRWDGFIIFNMCKIFYVVIREI